MADFIGVAAYQGSSSYSGDDPGASQHGQIKTAGDHTIHYGNNKLTLGGIDAETGAALGLGTTNATTITLGRTGQTVDIKGSLVIRQNLVVEGTTTTVESETVLLADNHLYLNNGYNTVAAQTGGLVVNYLPTSTTTTTVGSGVFTAGVDGVSDPTVTTAGAATFAQYDLIQISGSANNGENDGIFEVLSHAANLLTIRSTVNGITDQKEDFTQDQFVTNAGDTGCTITKLNLSIMRSATDGDWEVAKGANTGASGLTFTKLSLEGGTTLQTAYDAGQTISITAALGPVVLSYDDAYNAMRFDDDMRLNFGTGEDAYIMWDSGLSSLKIASEVDSDIGIYAYGTMTLDAGPSTGAAAINLYAYSDDDNTNITITAEKNFGTATIALSSQDVITLYSEGATTLTGAGINLAGGSSEIDLTSTGALDLNSGAGTWDASTLSIDSTDTTNFTMTANAEAAKTMTISAANDGGGDAHLYFTSKTDTTFNSGGRFIVSSKDNASISTEGSLSLTSVNGGTALLGSTLGGNVTVSVAGGAGDILISTLFVGSNITIKTEASGSTILLEAVVENAPITLHTTSTWSNISLLADDSNIVLTAAQLIDINAGTGGFNIDSTATASPSNVSHVGSSGNDLTVSCTDGSLVLQGGENATDAVYIYAAHATGGITLQADGGIYPVDKMLFPSAQAQGSLDLLKVTGVTGGAPSGAAPDGSLAYDETNDVFYGRINGVWVQLLSSIDGNTLNQAYDQGGAGAGRTITVDSGAVALDVQGDNTALYVEVNQANVTNPVIKIDWVADQTGTGLDPTSIFVDYSGLSNLSNDNDVRGIRLVGKTNAGTGASVGLSLGAGWDRGIEMPDLTSINFGTGENAIIYFDGTTYRMETSTRDSAATDPIVIRSGATSTSGASGVVQLRSGAASGASDSGAATILTGTTVSGTSGSITASTGDSGSGTSGSITLETGTGVETGWIYINPGAATTGIGGRIYLTGGSSASGTPGVVAIRGGYATGGTEDGASVSINGGSTVGGVAGSVFIGDTSAYQVTIDSINSFSIDGGAASNVTTSAGDLIIGGATQANSVVIQSAEATDDAVYIYASSGDGGITLQAEAGILPLDKMLFPSAQAQGSLDLLKVTGVTGGAPSGAAPDGSLAYDEDNDVFYGRISGSWVAFSTTIGSTLQAAYVAGNTITTSLTEGDVTITGTEAMSIDMDKASSFNVTGANLTLSTTTSGTLAVTSAALLDLDGVTVQLDATTGGFSIDSSATGTGSNLTHVGAAGNDLTVSCSSGSLILHAGEAAVDAIRIVTENVAGGIDIDAGTTSGVVTIDAGGSITLTGAGVNLAGGSTEIDLTTTGALDLNSGAGTWDSSAGISLAAAGASSFATSSGDITLDASAGVLQLDGATKVEIASAGQYFEMQDTVGTSVVTGGLRFYWKNGAPVAEAFGTGSLIVDYANGALYINQGTSASPSWVKVGSQS